MSYSVGSIISSISSLAALAFYIWVIVMFAKECKKPKEERRNWPKVLFIVFTSIAGTILVLAIGLIALSFAIVANM